MSHFTVLVIGDYSDSRLEPFCEDPTYVDGSYLEFRDIEDEYKDEFKYGETEVIRYPDGSCKLTWNARKDDGIDDKAVPEGYKLEKMAFKVMYETYEEYLQEWQGMQKDDDTGKYGYWYNPNAKWDWHEIGGRWKGSLILKKGKKGDIGSGGIMERMGKDSRDYTGRADQARVGDINWKAMNGNTAEAKKEKSLFWDLYVKDKAPKDETERAKKEEFSKGFHYKREYYTDRYKTKANYLKNSGRFTTFAVLDENGEWHEPGTMGWFGCSSAKPDDENAWNENYYEAFIKNLDPDTQITVVDCHI